MFLTDLYYIMGRKVFPLHPKGNVLSSISSIIFTPLLHK